jgi:HD-like signal output (HDOD) protein
VKRVLFVDDEPMILGGLRNALRKQRSKWDMVFVESGEAALAAFEQAPFDVVVTDMRMPGMDGAALLQKVRERYPQAARVILSGQASSDDMLRAMGAMQQFLSKPCDVVELCDVVERLCRVQALLTSEKIRAVVGSLQSLPSFPGSYTELTAVMELPNSSLADIGAIVKRDAGLSAKVLQLANSAYCGNAQPTASVQSAVRHVGLSVIKALSLSTHVFSEFSTTSLNHPLLTSLPDRSLMKAELASSFAASDKRADEAFTAALLLNIGQIVLARCYSAQYLPILELAASSGRALHEVEFEQLGVTHAEVGAYLLGVWGLPFTLVELVACHHAPALLTLTPNTVLNAVHVADVLVDQLYAGRANAWEAVEVQIRQRPEVSARLAEWQTQAEVTMRAA